MIQQVMLSGNLKRGIPIIFQKEDVCRVLAHIETCQYTGLTVYADGNFLTIYEGKPSLIEASRIAYANTTRYDEITTLISHPIETRHFSKFNIGLRHADAGKGVEDMEECFIIKENILNDFLPHTLSVEFKTLLKTFWQVNNLS